MSHVSWKCSDRHCVVMAHNMQQPGGGGGHSRVLVVRGRAALTTPFCRPRFPFSRPPLRSISVPMPIKIVEWSRAIAHSAPGGGGGGGRSPYDLLRTRVQKKGSVFRHTASSMFFLKKGCFFPLYRHLGVLFRKVGFDPFRHSELGAEGKIWKNNHQ